jgi:Methylase involved in ubiquinone/menaquinone biosynthesis
MTGSGWLIRCNEAATNFINLIKPSLYDDDVIADFGCRIGNAADTIKDMVHIPVTCVDISEEFIAECVKKGHKSVCARLEDMPLADASVDWGFCSHTIEHVKDLGDAMKELTRVVKRGLFLVFPLEDKDVSDVNPSHMHYSSDPDYFIKPFEELGWKRGWFEPLSIEREDYQVFLYR